MKRLNSCCCYTDFGYRSVGGSIYEFNRKNRDHAIAEYGSDGGICYVDGVKQDDSFDIYGIDLDSYTVSYEEGKLYPKIKKMRKNFSLCLYQ